MASLSHRLFRGRISIHALREEGDWIWCASWGLFLQFLSTPSARRATCVVYAPPDSADISIHALREEGDLANVRIP